MKIGIDARICGEPGYYGQFVCELVEAFCQEHPDMDIVVYTKENLPLRRNSFFDDLKARKVFDAEKFTHMIFFDYHIPAGYKGDYSLVLEGLKEVFFPKKKWFQRKIYTYKLKEAIRKAKTVITLDGGSALELNERLNVPEEKIEKLPGFFPQYVLPKENPLKIDIKTKHNIRGPYLIYDSGNEVHNNFERILRVLQKLKEKEISVSIIILCDATSIDLDIRNKVIELDITGQVLFLGHVPIDHESAYYTQSDGVIFSSIYESFPFQFSKALAYNCHIFANEIPVHEHTMGDTISYLDPLSIHNMCDSIVAQLNKPKKTDYKKIRGNLSPQKSAISLSSILKLKD